MNGILTALNFLSMKKLILFTTLTVLTCTVLATGVDTTLIGTEERSSQFNRVSTALATDNPGSWTYTKISEENIRRAVEVLPGIIESAMEKTSLPGIAVAVVRADKVLLAQGFGLREVGKPQQVDADTVFQLASLSKSVGATVVSHAVSNGSVGWNDPVVQHLPWFRIGDDYVTRNVTIADLYSHRSGLPDHGGDDLEDLGFDRQQILRRLAKLPLGLFRVQYAYTNFGLTAAAEAVAKANTTSWEQLSKDLLYHPAGMNSTSSKYTDYLSASNRAINHQRRKGIWVPGPPRNPQPESPAGGVSSTANDLARWLQLQLGNGTLNGKELIKPDVMQIMRQPHIISKRAKIPAVRSSLYGFGFGTGVDGTGHVRWSHSGAFQLGVATNFVILPAGDIAIAVITNGEPHGIPEAITATFADIVETGRPSRDWLPLYEKLFSAFYVNPSKLAGKVRPTIPNPPLPLNDYAGTYQNDYFGPATVSIVGSKLEIALGPVPHRFTLTHWNGDEFSYYPTGENALGISAVNFNFSPHGQKVTVEHLDEFKLGTFVK